MLSEKTSLAWDPIDWHHKGFKYGCALLALVVCFLLVKVTHYTTHDPDTHLYAALAADTAHMPLSNWSALAWGGHWNRTGWFYEHPPGLFWLGALFVRMGQTPLHAVYSVSFICFFLSLWFLF